MNRSRLIATLIGVRYFILVPLVIIVVLFVVIVMLTEGKSIAPFVYAIF